MTADTDRARRRAGGAPRTCAPRSCWRRSRVVFFVGIIAAQVHRRRRRSAIGVHRAPRCCCSWSSRSAATCANERATARDDRARRARATTARCCVKLGVVVRRDVRLRLRAGAVLREDLRGHRPARHRAAPTTCSNTQVDARAACASSSTPTCASCRGQFRPLETDRRRASGRAAPGRCTRSSTRPTAPMTGQAIPSYGPPQRRAVLPEARVLLLRQADAAAGRAAADAGGVRRRSRRCRRTSDDHAVVHVLRGRGRRRQELTARSARARQRPARAAEAQARRTRSHR